MRLYSYYNKGILLEISHKHEEAIHQFDNILNLDKENIPALIEKANSLVELGRWDEAETLYRRAIKIAPGNGNPYNYLGMLLVREGRYDEGISEFNKALKIAGNYKGVHNNLGCALFAKARISSLRFPVYHLKANKEFKTAIEMNDTYGRAHRNLWISKRCSNRALWTYLIRVSTGVLLFLGYWIFIPDIWRNPGLLGIAILILILFKINLNRLFGEPIEPVLEKPESEMLVVYSRNLIM